LLDGVGDLPHPDLAGKTPLEAATTKNMDILAKNGIMGQVISVGKGIAPESDIAVFNMLGYKFQHSDYVGRGVIEAIGIGVDFKDGDLALRGNFATLDNEGKIIDRRAGRKIEREDTEKISKEIEKKISNKIKNLMMDELKTLGTFGLKTKKELWKTQTELSRVRLQARSILALRQEERERKEPILIQSLSKIGLVDQNSTLDDVLNLQVNDL